MRSKLLLLDDFVLTNLYHGPGSRIPINYHVSTRTVRDTQKVPTTSTYRYIWCHYFAVALSERCFFFAFFV